MRRAMLGAVAVAVAVAAVLAIVGCGDDQEAGAVREAPVETAIAETERSPPAPPSREQRRDDPDGTLTTDSGRIIRNWGPARERRAVVALLVGIQSDFRAGRMAQVCAALDDFGLLQFNPGGARPYAPCPVKMHAYARKLERRGPTRIRLLWVRAYEAAAGIWVEDEHGERFRVPFSDWDGRGWRFEFGLFGRPDILYGRLAGADAYVGGA